MNRSRSRTPVHRPLLWLAALTLTACAREATTPTLVDLDGSGAFVSLVASNVSASTGDRITVAVSADHAERDEHPLGAFQGTLTWNSARLRFVGEIPTGTAQVVLNETSLDDGVLPLAAIDPDGLAERVAFLAFDVVAPGYAGSLRFETRTAADLDFVVYEPKDVPGLRTATDLPSPASATSLSLAERVLGVELGEMPLLGGPSRIPGAADLYGDGNEDGVVNVFDALYVANVSVGNTALGPCVVATERPARDCLAVNVEPSNLPGLGESTDTCPPGVDNACAAPAGRTVDALDWLAVSQEVVGGDHPVVGEPIPNARGGADRTSPTDTVVLTNPPTVTDTLVFSADTLYVLAAGELVVGDEAGAAGTVIFEPGVVFEGTDSTTGIRVTRNGRIIAHGTATEPITFSCLGPDPQPGCWRGLAILGNAVLNADLAGPGPTIPARNPGGGGGTIAIDTELVFGGSNDADDSGVLRYVRVLYGGARNQRGPGDFTLYSGLRLGACGSGTVIEYVQAHASGQDGIQILGGRCDLSHIVVSEAGDDLFDLSWGYDGDMQFIVGAHGPGADEAFEVDNTNDPGSYDAFPRTAPRIWNLTVIGGTQGSPFATGLDWQRGAQGEVRNALLVETQSPFRVADPAPTGSCGRLPGDQDLLFFDNIVVLGRDGVLSESPDCAAELATYLGTVTGLDDRSYAGELRDPFTGWLPDLRPVGTGVTSAATSPATPTGGLDPSGTYFGAVTPEGVGGAVPWYAGWFVPWEPIPPSLSGFRVAVSCLDRLGLPTECAVGATWSEGADSIWIEAPGDTLSLPPGREVRITAVDSVSYWGSETVIVQGIPGDTETIVLDLDGRGGEFCGGDPETFDLVRVVPLGGCPAPGTVSTAEEAIFLVRDGGTIEFDQGEHRANNLQVFRDGLTLRSAPGANAVILPGNDLDQSYDGPAFMLRGTGNYRVEDLTFRSFRGQFSTSGLGLATGPNSIYGVGEYESVTILRSRFEGMRISLITLPSTTAAPRIDVIDSDFVLDVPGSFTSGRGLFMIDNADYTVENSPAITVRDSRFTGTPEKPIQAIWDANGIFARDTGLPRATTSLLVEDNEFSYCGVCLDLRAATDGVIVRGNTFTAPADTEGGASALNYFAPIGASVVEDNVVTGFPSPNAYTFEAFVTVTGADATGAGGGALQVTGNAVSGVRDPLFMDASYDGSLTATDNTFDDVTTAVRQDGVGPTDLTVTGNDFTNYTQAWTGPFSAGALTCNWWGAPTGPGPSVPDAPTVASPWTSGAVANGAGGVCDQVAAQTTWTGGGDGSSWGDAANWSDGVPTATSTVVIGVDAGASVVMDQTAQIANLLLGSTVNTNTLTTNGFDLNVTGDAQMTFAGALTVSGTLTVGGTLANFGTVTMTTGMLDGAVENAGNLIVSLPSALGAAPLTNTGAVFVQSDLDVLGVFGNSGSIVVDPSGSLTFFEVNAELTLDAGNITGSGEVRFLDGAVATLNSRWDTDNLTVTASLSTIGGPDTLAVSPASTVDVFAGTLSAPVLNQGSILLSPGTIDDLTNEGTLTVHSASTVTTLTTTASSTVLVQGLGFALGSLTVTDPLTNLGEITLGNGTNGAGSELNVTSGTLTNAAGAVFSSIPTNGGTRTLNADLDTRGSLQIATPTTVNGQLIVPTGTSADISGTNPLTVSGLDVDGLFVDGVPLISVDGSLDRFDDVAIGVGPTQAAITIFHPGDATPFTMDALTFFTEPSTGFYVVADDNTADANTLTIDITNTTPPSDGPTSTQTTGGAVVNWVAPPQPNVRARWMDTNDNPITTASQGETVVLQICVVNLDAISFEADIGSFDALATATSVIDLDSSGGGVHPDCQATAEDDLDDSLTSSALTDPITASIASIAADPPTDTKGAFSVVFTLDATGSLTPTLTNMVLSLFSGPDPTAVADVQTLTVN